MSQVHRKRIRRCVIGVAFAALTAPASSPRADEASNKAAAQALFDDGKELVKAGKYPEACPKFRESQRLDPRVATQFKLADCYEHIGRTASAWVNFLEVAAATKAAGDAERERVARGRAVALEPKLSRLTVKVPDEAVSGLVVRRDGEVVGKPQWGIAVPVDPGEHPITAEAPGKRAWQTKVQVPADAASVSLSVPPLEDAPAAPARAETKPDVAPAAQPSESRGGGQRAAGIVVGAVGLVGVGVGAAFGLMAISKQNDSKPYCRTADLCTQPGLDLVSDAKRDATISTIGFVAGGVALAAGIVLFATAPSSRGRGVGMAIAPYATREGGGAAWVGAW